MERLFVDTSAWFAYANRKDPDHAAVREVFDLTPAGIIRDLDLKRPIYAPTAAYGHFGRSDKEFPWEAGRKEQLSCVPQVRDRGCRQFV